MPELQCLLLALNNFNKFELSHLIVILNYMTTFFQIVDMEIPFKEQFNLNVLFREPEIRLDIPSAIVGDGWRFIPSTEPLGVSNRIMH